MSPTWAKSRFEGEGAFDFVQYVTTNDVSKLVPGKAQYSLLLNETGGIVDDIIVYRFDEDFYLIVLNAGCKDNDWEWLQARAEGRANVTLRDVSHLNALIAVQGPKAVEIAASLAIGKSVNELKRFHFVTSSIHSADGPLQVHFSRTGYTRRRWL